MSTEDISGRKEGRLRGVLIERRKEQVAIRTPPIHFAILRKINFAEERDGNRVWSQLSAQMNWEREVAKYCTFTPPVFNGKRKWTNYHIIQQFIYRYIDKCHFMELWEETEGSILNDQPRIRRFGHNLSNVDHVNITLLRFCATL